MHKGYLGTIMLNFFFPTVKSHAHRKKNATIFIISNLWDFFCVCHFSVSFDGVNKKNHFLITGKCVRVTSEITKLESVYLSCIQVYVIIKKIQIPFFND